MPTDTSTTSDQADEHSNDRFVLDFLYHDSRRIGSFLSQFEGDGHLQQLQRSQGGVEGKTDASKRGTKADIGSISGNIEGTIETTLASAEGLIRVFDPYWANARAFLNYLSDRDMLNRQLAGAQVGQFVLVKGHLSILDLSMMKEAWKLPSVQRKVFGGASKPTSQMTAAQKAEQKEEKENTELLLDMMGVMPHSVHATILNDDEQFPALIWGALREEYLVQPASEITLAHGARVPGSWSIVGILTALPEFAVPTFESNSDDGEVGMMTSMVAGVSKVLAPVVRVALGRPAAAYAVTPLLIFREVT